MTGVTPEIARRNAEGGRRRHGEIKRYVPMTAPLLEGHAPKRKSASHGEAGYARAARDAYFTEPWVTRALLAAVELLPADERHQPVWEPACGDGRMARELVAAGYSVFASDIHDYGWPNTRIIDFLRAPMRMQAAAVVTNPPFDLAREFVREAIACTRTVGKVAILQRHEFDAPRVNRDLFRPPFAAKLILPRRPRWATADKAGPRFPYAWYLWDWAWSGEPVIRWLDDPDQAAPAERLL